MTTTSEPQAEPEPDDNGAIPIVGRPRSITRLLTRTGITAWSIVGILVLLWASLWLLSQFQVLLAPVVLATVLIYVLNPVVNLLKNRLHIHRIIATVIAYVIMIGAIVLLGFLVLPSVSDQAQELAAEFPTIYEDSATEIEGIMSDVGFETDVWSYQQVEDFLNDPENQDQMISAALDRLGAFTSGLFEAILVFFVAPVVAFYVLIDLDRIRRESESLIPPPQKDEVIYVSRQLGWAVGGFLRGQVLVAIIVGVMMSFGYWLIGLRFWLIIGMVSGFLNIVPFIGPVDWRFSRRHRRVGDGGRRHRSLGGAGRPDRAATRQQLHQPDGAAGNGSTPPGDRGPAVDSGWCRRRHLGADPRGAGSCVVEDHLWSSLADPHSRTVLAGGDRSHHRREASRAAAGSNSTRRRGRQGASPRR